MEYGQNIEKEVNPRKTANIFSKITFWYTRPLFQKGFKNELQEEDLYEVLPEFDTRRIGDTMEAEWNSRKHQRFAMFFIFWKLFGRYYIFLSSARIFSLIILAVRPFIMGKLVFYFTPGQKTLTKFDAYMFSVLLLTLQILDVVCRSNYCFLAESLAIKLRTAICSLLYRKFLKLRVSHLRNISVGTIINLITRDINVFTNFFILFNEGVIGLFSITIICYNLYQGIGLPALVVLIIFAIFIPLQVVTSIWTALLKLATSVKTDIRIGILQEALTNIKSIKMYVWEKYLLQRITRARKDEIHILLKMTTVLFSTVATAIIINNVAFYLVLMTNVWLGQSITAETMYFVTGCFMGLGHNFISTIPYATFYLAQILVAIKRMQTIVQNLEVDAEREEEVPATPEPRIQMKNVTISTAAKVILKDVDFNVNEGLTLVTGYVGSGKSVLLMTLLKEFEVSKGHLFIEGRISYAPQEPWLFPSTIKQNIIFGNEYNEKRYQDVVRACALVHDFSKLEHGDCTIIADRGINLSKGQQCRISLARAIYRKSEIYLLDDCLSCLDPLVARFIFVNCISKFLQDKLVMLVSDNMNLQPYAKNILKLNNNKVELRENIPLKVPEETTDHILLESDTSSLEKSETEDDLGTESKCLLENKTSKIYGESGKSTIVSLPSYIKIGGGKCFFAMIIIAFILTQFFFSYKDKLVSEWANLEDQISQSQNKGFNNSEHVEAIEKRNQLLIIYTVVTIGSSVSTFIRALLLFLFLKKISYNLHKKMLNSVIHATLKFFDRTFIGNIVNRFSKDLISIDENIPFNLHHVTVIISETLGSMLLISSTNPRFLIPMAILLTSFFFLRYFYLKIGKPLKRLDASTKSPIVGYYSATIEGLASVKAFRAEKILKEEFERRHNIYNSASYSHLTCIKTYAFAMQTAMCVFIAVVVFQFMIFEEGVLPGDAGLAISQAFVMAIPLYFAILNGAELDTQVTSVDRAFEYTRIQQEKRQGLELEKWPTKAEIQYKSVCLSVNDSKSFLLRNINFLIKSQEKVGIVGRTGAGKTSLLSALFRMYDTEGEITIDGIDIRTISLDFLRKHISVIPQDSVLVGGSLRDNMDPGKLYQDEELYKALETVKLKQFIPSLDVDVKDLGFTSGQKQLICLARVLIHNNKIVVLDEMVENVDEKTESFIHEIIDEKFASCTVIKIAHKLKFVIGCDKIMVIENGEIVEYDAPRVLLRKKNGFFYKMANTSGFGLTYPTV